MFEAEASKTPPDLAALPADIPVLPANIPALPADIRVPDVPVIEVKPSTRPGPQNALTPQGEAAAPDNDVVAHDHTAHGPEEP